MKNGTTNPSTTHTTNVRSTQRISGSLRRSGA
jgi:hypothetical protein